MKISWSHGAHVACFGKIFNDGWGAIIWMKWQKKPWIWKVEGESMKAFWSGFWRGALKSSLIFGGIGGFCAALYMLKVICEWLYSVYGELGSVIVLTIFTILLAGIIQGCWVHKHYRYHK